MIKFTIIITALVMMSSCFAISPYSLTHLEKSMSKSEVLDIMGAPDTKKLINNREILVWYLYDSVFSLLFIDKFPFFAPFPLGRTGKPHIVVLIDGKVVGFGVYSKNLPDTSFRNSNWILHDNINDSNKISDIIIDSTDLNLN